MEISIRQGLPGAAWVPIASLRRSKQLETAKEQPGNWLFFRSLEFRRPRISAETRVRWLVISRQNSKNSGRRGKAGAADRGGDRGAEVLGPGVAAEIGRARAALGENLGDGALDGRGRRGLTEMVEHHCARPDLADRVGDPAAGNVRRRTVHRLEHRRVVALGIYVAGRRDADRT